MTAPTPSALPFVWLGVATVLAVALGTFSHDLARWIVCIRATKTCSEDAKTTARMIATLVSTLLAIFVAAQAGMTGKRSLPEARLMVIGALAGALFAMLKAAEGKAGYPELRFLWRPLMIYVMAVVLLTGPMLHRNIGTGTALMQLYQRMAITFAAAMLIGVVLQWPAHVLWTVPHDNGSVRKFVLSPAAAIIGGALFGAVMQVVSERDSSRRAVLLWLALAGVMTVFWLQVYFSNFAPPEAFPPGSGPLPLWRLALPYGAVLLSGVVLVGALLLSGGLTGGALRAAGLVGLASLLAGVAGFYLGDYRFRSVCGAPASACLTEDDRIILALAQSAVPLCVWLAVLTGRALHSGLHRLNTNPPAQPK